MEKFFTKKVQNVFAILKRTKQEEGATAHEETKKIKSDEVGTDDKNKNASSKLDTEKDPRKEPKRKLNNDASSDTNKKESTSTETRDNNHSVIKKPKLMKLHNKDNVYLIDDFINIKKNNEGNCSSGKDVKKKEDEVSPKATSATIASRATLNTPSICSLLSTKKKESDSKANAQETRLIKSNTKSAGGLEQTLHNPTPDQTKTDNNPKEGKNTNLVPKTNTCTKDKEQQQEEEEEEEEKKKKKDDRKTTEKKKNSQKEEQNDQAFLKSMTDKKNETKKQKNNSAIFNTNNSNQSENSPFAKDSGGEKRVNRIDEMFKSLIEESKKKDKQLGTPDASGNTPCQVNHINNSHEGSAIEEEKKEKNLDDEPESTKEVDEYNPNDNAPISNAEGKIVTQETLHKDGEPGEEGKQGNSPTNEAKLQKDEPPQCNGSPDSLWSAKTNSPTPSRSSSVGSGPAGSSHSCSFNRSFSPSKKDTKSMGESQPEEQAPLCGTDKSTTESECATPSELPCDISQTEEAEHLKIKFPQFAMNQSKNLINETNEFFNMYDLNLKVEYLPMGISNDLKLLVERKRKIGCIINDYKNELRQRNNHSSREEKNEKGTHPQGGQLQNTVEGSSVGKLSSEKQENEATTGKYPPHDDDNNNNGVARDESNNVNQPTGTSKTEEVKPVPPTMENKPPVKNCETVNDQHDVEFVQEDKNRSSAKETANHVQDGINEEEVKKGNNHMQGRKKRQGQEKKLEKGVTSYDNLNYLSDDDKEFVEREHRNFLTLLEKVNLGDCAGGGAIQICKEQQPGDTNHLGEGSHLYEESHLGDRSQLGEGTPVEAAPQVGEAQEAKVTKEEFIKSLMQDLTQDCSEEMDYEQHKEIKDEETKFEKMKETIKLIKIKEKKIDVLLSSSENLFKYTNMYRRRQILHEKMLMNWSYVQNSVNKKNDVRNRNLPFQLLELDKDLTKNVPKAYDDILLDHFSGIIITLNTTSSETTVDGNAIHVKKIVCGCLIEYLGRSEINIKCIWVHPFLNAKSTYYILSAFLPRVILEAFLNYKAPSQKENFPNHVMDSSRLKEENTAYGTLQEMTQSKKKKSFYDRLHQLNESNPYKDKTMKKEKTEKWMDNNSTNEEDSFFNNFVMQQYPAMYFLNFSKDCAELLKNFDRQTVDGEKKNEEGNRYYSYPTWAEEPPHEEDFPSAEHTQDKDPDEKNKSGENKVDKFIHIIFSDIDIFPRQCYLLLCSYKYMCLNMHYDTDCYSVHYDLNLKNIQKENIGKNTEVSNACPCTSVNDVSSDAEDSYERIIGCSELYMYYMMPKREEREKLGLLERNGWRDLIPNTFNEDISENISSIVKTKTSISNLYEHISIQNKQNEKNYTTAYINKYEWCGLKIKDIRNMMNEDFNYESPKKK
ncbi:hypothetical protein AK88_00069 [Plasmodium fragile]|uniref:Uncharacterized protein n=1 Tax=Plasmodium fragile TaxID=5857 RepID=A0A0D9QUD6_PLAFR|nr:uncharacterized protein AK88_00069 [Plasmodium fragile]KJP90221.1 hypothetical protein AK88_00069 [Plasmodium fragile]